MIDFRYHLVSIVAVFLALAIGIVLGSTELQGYTIDGLRKTSDALSRELSAADAQRGSFQAEASDQDQFLQSNEPRLLAGLLTGQRVVIVTEPGAQGSVVDGVKQAAGYAGATVTGEVALQPKFNDISGANQSSLSGINDLIAGNDGITLTTGTDPQTSYQQQAAQLISDAILERSTTVQVTANQVSLTPAGAQAVLSTYAQDGYLTISGAPTDMATLAVLVTPQDAPTDGPNDPANQVLLAIAQEFAGASAATLVAGGTAGSTPPASAMAVLRSSSVSAQVSSVDNADTTLGQLTVIQALAAQLAGAKPNSYGISGASAVSPTPPPSPSATATATATATPHPTTTGNTTGKARKKR